MRCNFFALACAGLLACDKPAPQPPAAAEPAAEHDHSQHDHSQHVLSAVEPLPSDSIYHTRAQLTDQAGQPFELSSLRGSAVLATMFYSSCTTVCPVLISQLKRIVEALPEDARAHTQVLLVSLDPARDSPEKLKELAERHNIADPRWHFVRADEHGVREISALLGIRYRQLPDGEISHSQLITLLDKNGAIQQRMQEAAGDPALLVAAATQAARH
jgi:protein SCO1/2